MNKVLHMTLAPKGGVGKSLIAALLAQWLIDTGQEPTLYDNDALTPTLTSYRALPVQKVDLLRGYEVDKSAYDTMFVGLMNSGSLFVMDNGTSNFQALQAYIVEAALFEVLEEMGVQTYVHYPILGKDDLANSLTGLETVASLLAPSTKIVAWSNLVKGPIEHAGMPLEKMAPFKRSADKIFGQVTIPEADEQRKDALLKMLTERRTFAEVLASEDFHVIDRSRLRRYRDEIYLQLNQVFGAPRTEDEAA